MRTKAFVYNSFFSFLLQIITMISGFIIPRLMLSGYGSEINGLVTSINQFLSYFTLIEAGLASAAVYALYKPLANSDYKGINSILSATKKFYSKIAVYYVLLVILLAISYPFIVKSISLSNKDIIILILVMGCAGVIDFLLMSKYRVLLTANQKVFVVSIASLIYVILNTLIIGILAYYKVDIVILRTVALFSIFIRSLILYLYVRKYYKYVNYNSAPNYSALNKRWDALYLQILGSINNGAPIIIGTIFLSLKSISVYSVYNLVFAGLSGVLSIFTSGLSSSFGDVIARKEVKTLQKAYKEFEYAYYIIISWAYSCVLILILPFISVYTQGISDTNYYLPVVSFLFTLNGILYNLKTPQGMLVISAGMFKETRVQTTIQGIMAILFSIIFVQLWGLAGLLVGMCVANLYRTIDLLIFVPRNITKLRIGSSLTGMLRVLFTIIICYIPFAFIDIKIENIFHWFILALFIAIYCLLIVVLINYLLDRETFKRVLERMMGQFRKGKA